MSNKYVLISIHGKILLQQLFCYELNSHSNKLNMLINVYVCKNISISKIAMIEVTKKTENGINVCIGIMMGIIRPALLSVYI